MCRALVVALSLLPLLALGQERPQRASFVPFTSQVQVLLDSQEQLSLTRSQGRRLRLLSEELDALNAPLQQRLGELRYPRRPPEPGATAEALAEEQRTRLQEVRDLFHQLSANDRAAYARAESLLSSAQRRKAHTLLEAERAERLQRYREQAQERLPL